MFVVIVGAAATREEAYFWSTTHIRRSKGSPMSIQVERNREREKRRRKRRRKKRQTERRRRKKEEITAVAESKEKKLKTMLSQSETGRKRKSGMAARDTHECTLTKKAIIRNYHVVSCV